MNEVLKGAFERARAAFIPVCDNECAALLEELCRRIKPRRVLEIGTAVGCSSSVMALSCDCELDTVDVDGARIEEAHKLWRDLGIEGRIHAYLGDVRQLLFRITEGKKYGIVVISPDFIQKKWTAYEFNGMISKEMAGGKMILPIWHNVTKDAVIAYSPTLADKVALNTSIQTVAEIATELKKLVSI